MPHKMVCYAGQHSHGYTDYKYIYPKALFEPAIARIFCWTHRKLNIYVCKRHLNSYLDHADENPSWEPDGIEWL